MGVKVRENTIDYDPVPGGLHIAHCIGTWDIGTHYEAKWGKKKKEVVIMWELPELRIMVPDSNGVEVDMPRSISKRYNSSLYESNLLKDLEGWRGEKFSDEELKIFDLDNVLGKPCQLSVIHNDKGKRIYANVDAIVRAPKGYPVQKTENKLRSFDMEETMAIPSDTPEWIKKLIESSDEYKGDNGHEPSSEPGANDVQSKEHAVSDDLPF